MSDLTGPEKEGSQEGLRERIDFHYDPEVMRGLTFVDAQDQKILGIDEDLSRPLQSICITIDGSPNENGGEFLFQTVLTLRDEAKRRDVQKVLEAVSEEFYASEEDTTVPSYLFMSGHQFYYLVGTDEDYSEVTITSCGSYDFGRTPVMMDNLEHGKDEAETAFADFLSINKDVISLLYEGFGKRSKRLHFELDPEKYGQESEEVEPEPPEVELEEVSTIPAERLDDIGGLAAQKEEIRDVIDALRHPEIMVAWGADRPHGILLYGPQGTGKTTIAKAIAGELGASLTTISVENIYKKFMGESEGNFAALLEKARSATKPVAIFFNELDGIITNSGSAYQTVKAMFKQRIAEIQDANPNLIVLADTNNMDVIDPTLLREGRFDTKLYIPLPDEASRKEIFGKIISRKMFDPRTRRNLFDMDLNYQELALLTEELSGSDINGIIRRILMAKGLYEIRTETPPPSVTQEELVQAIARYKERPHA